VRQGRRQARRRAPELERAAGHGALQAQDFHTPAYSEADATTGGFGLNYAAMNATDVRTELEARFDDPTLLFSALEA
jgi:hypothetical protein